MPSTDIAITSIKISRAVDSYSPQIKPEAEEKVSTSGMTQSPANDTETMSRTSPSKVSEECVIQNCDLETTKKMSGRKARESATSVADQETENGRLSTDMGMRSTKSGSCGDLKTHMNGEDLNSKLRRASAITVGSACVKIEADSETDRHIPVSVDGEESNRTTVQNGFKEVKLSSPKKKTESKRRASCSPLVQSPEHLDRNDAETQGGNIGTRLPSGAHYPQLQTAFTPLIALERKHECEKCGVSFHSKKTYEVHIKHYCSGKRHHAECRICGAKFEDEERLSMHMQAHEQHFMCLLCSEHTYRIDDCKSHMANHVVAKVTSGNNFESFSCPGCEYLSYRKVDIIRHMLVNHVTTGSMMPFLVPCPPATRQHLPKRKTPTLSEHASDTARQDEVTMTKNDIDLNDQNPLPRTPPRSPLDDEELRNMSPPTITSTPARPSSTSELSTQEEKDTFSCIVCSLAFPDVVELQRHLLTSHTNSQRQNSPPMAPSSRSKATAHDRHKGRKMSTVTAPPLALLSGLNHRKATELPHLVTSRTVTEERLSPRRHSTHSPYRDQANVGSYDEMSSNKRKERACEEYMTSDEMQTKHMSLKRVRRDSPTGDFHSKRTGKQRLDVESNADLRRISCPVVSNKLPDGGLCGVSSQGGNTSPYEESNCIQCDIKFFSAANYRAHKKYYCATRHIHKNADDSPSDLTTNQMSENAELHEQQAIGKLRKRNAGNRSSITARKKSHLIPLETVRDRSPFTETAKENPMPTARKSCPSEVGSFIDNSAGNSSPGRNESPHAVSIMAKPKKYQCQECNIWYSKYDTYMAHKKYYCESRRKDRGGQRISTASIKAATKRKSESNLRETVSRAENLAVTQERRVWSPPRTPPSTDGDEERPLDSEDNEGGAKDPQKAPLVDNARFPFAAYGQSPIVNHEMLARISFMHYLAMMRSQEMCTNGFMFPNLSAMNVLPMGLPAGNNANKTHRRSLVDIRPESNIGEFGTGVGEQAIPSRRFSEAQCGLIRKGIQVKQEPGDFDDANESPTENCQMPRRVSPLDLSNKNASESPQHGGKAIEKEPEFPYPTIDLRTTAMAIKLEPGRDSPIHTSIDAKEDSNNVGNDNNNNNMSERDQPKVAISHSQGGVNAISPRSRVQHCKNCNARFTSLSTFIAHKKYYCSASNSNGLHCNDAKAAQMAHC